MINDVTLGSPGTQRSRAEADPVSGTRRSGYAVAAWLSPIGVPSVPQNYYSHSIMIIYSTRTWRQKRRVRTDFMGRGWYRIYSRSERVTSEVISDEEKQRQV